LVFDVHRISPLETIRMKPIQQFEDSKFAALGNTVRNGASVSQPEKSLQVAGGCFFYLYLGWIL
jgi:hypothetical protein